MITSLKRFIPVEKRKSRILLNDMALYSFSRSKDMPNGKLVVDETAVCTTIPILLSLT
jgi:hypothetical protein